VAGLGSALGNLEQAWQKVETLARPERVQLAYGPDLVAKVAAARLACDQADQARQVLQRGRDLYGDHPALLLRSIAADCRFLADSAQETVRAGTESLLARIRRDIDTLCSENAKSLATPCDDRFRTLYPLRYQGELALLEGRVGEAAELFEKALTIDDSYSFAWLGLAECARYAGDRKRALKLYLRTVTESEWNHRAWLRGCSLLEELGFHDNAASWLRKVAVQFPEHPQAGSPIDIASDRQPSLRISS
jgi:tetratricopeptide (TPR) repeat protein